MCVCVHNLSVGRQVYTNLEIIVVDDGSSDARYRLLSQIQYTRTSSAGVTQRVNVSVLHMQVCQHTYAYVSIRQHTAAYGSVTQRVNVSVLHMQVYHAHVCRRMLPYADVC